MPLCRSCWRSGIGAEPIRPSAAWMFWPCTAAATFAGVRLIGGQSVGIANLATCQQPLRRRGFVAISVDDADKRSRRLRLTLAGRALGGAPKRGFRCRRRDLLMTG